jgi:predicted TIM-barrel fold metal-dependent hydrolase
MKIINPHYHLGECRVYDVVVTEKDVFNDFEKNGISAVILQPLPGAPNAKQVHKRIYELSKEYPDKIFGLVSINPHVDDEIYLNEVDTLIKDYHFVGLKLHTVGHAINPLGKDAKKVFDAARKYKVPVMVHTGVGLPFASPALVLPRASEYPDVKIVLAHAGYGFVVSPEAFAVAKVTPNVYLETSWDDIYSKWWFINEIGADKVMFGSDLPINTTTELHQYRSLGLPEETLEKCLYNTAKQVFNLPI